jgi:membrane protein YqaA with SNARE-associated domain
MENTSGQGKQAVIPTELRGWNWGAFLMNWVWGIFNKTYISLLTFVPLVGMLMPFVLGFKGNAWAWRNKRWESVEHFRKVQRKWAMWGVIMLVVSLLASAGAVFLIFEELKNSEPYVMAMDKVQMSGEVQQAVGAPIKPGWWLAGNVSADRTGGKAELSFPLEGSKSKGAVHVKATKANNRWKLDELYFLPEVGGAAINLLKIQQPPPGQTRQPPPETAPPDKESSAPGKTTALPGAATGKGAQDTAKAVQGAPGAAKVVAAPVLPPQPAKAAAAEAVPDRKKEEAASKPRKKHAKKPPSKVSAAAAAGEKSPADLGRARITAGDYQGAIKILSAAIGNNPGESINYRLRGNAYDNMGKRDLAIEDWKKAASLGDTTIQSYLLFLQVEWP